MFTGIIEDMGRVVSIAHESRSAKVRIATGLTREDTRVGDSVAVSGACLTVTGFTNDGFIADAMPETLTRTTLGLLAPGNRVNLERALTLSARLGGHLVSGHVDGVGEVAGIAEDGIARAIEIRCDRTLLRYVAEKGSIAIDGVSLTVIAAGDERFSVAIIPHTAGHTTLNELKKGNRVNVECDLVAKHLERLLAFGPNVDVNAGGSGSRAQGESRREGASSALTEGFLRSNGF
jgi:riboflavin synthase